MPISCLDGDISDDQLDDWQAGALDVRVELTRAQVRAVFCGPCLSRGIALLGMNIAQLVKLYPSRARRKVARRLRFFATRLCGARVRAVLASATWHQLRAAARHDTEDAQIRAAIVEAVGRLPVKRRPPRRPAIGG